MFRQLEIRFLGVDHFTKSFKVYNFMFNGTEYGITESDICPRYGNGWALLDSNGSSINKSLENLDLLNLLVYCVKKMEGVK